MLYIIFGPIFEDSYRYRLIAHQLLSFNPLFPDFCNLAVSRLWQCSVLWVEGIEGALGVGGVAGVARVEGVMEAGR